MRTQLTLITAITLILGSCSSSYYSRTSTYEDDAYYSARNDPGKSIVNEPAISETKQATTPSGGGEDQMAPSRFEYKDSQQQTDKQGNTYVTNNYYNVDDYYDYSYSSRIRRFHHPARFSYYNGWYTNTYWYNYNPYYYGVSIYTGYSWWAPPHCVYYPWYYGGYYGYGHGYYPHHHGHHYYGYYGSSYWQGYHDGHHGYGHHHHGQHHNPLYFNSYDQNSYHYGPRGSVGSNSSYSPKTLATTYQAAVENDRTVSYPSTSPLSSQNDRVKISGSGNSRPTISDQNNTNNDTRPNIDKENVNIKKETDPRSAEGSTPSNNQGREIKNNDSRPNDGRTNSQTDHQYGEPSKSIDRDKNINTKPPVYENQPRQPEPKFEQPRTQPNPAPRQEYEQPRNQEPRNQTRPEQGKKRSESGRGHGSNEYERPQSNPGNQGGRQPSSGQTSPSPSRGSEKANTSTPSENKQRAPR